MAFAGPIGHALEAMKILKPYQLSRINVWLNPEAYPDTGGYQVLQGLYAIGSGGLFGKGLGESIQKLGFVPEAQNDMIFSIVCEELGLFGAGFILILFLILIYLKIYDGAFFTDDIIEMINKSVIAYENKDGEIENHIIYSLKYYKRIVFDG